ncbi:rhodanese-like domain-containing protein [Actinomadura madurae]|uniref:rhodanese-like domain-containing protein n=1 Tax=Actinomadura madurae TaxID=1993 RepID=UPI0020D20C3E|nr:rhodanese-like domain-containing protein [Actinomadura madurae]MCP9955263.1 rhodanese-like domain-containing protein [Actinomadura madurae]
MRPTCSPPTRTSGSTGRASPAETRSPPPTRWSCGAWPPRGTPSITCPTSCPVRAGPKGSSPAARCCSAPPAAPTCSAPSTPTTWPAGQHASARRLADLLPDGAHVWPTHGFGSFCSASQSDAASSTIGRERRTNPVLRLEADDFVTRTLDGLDAYPAYYAHMGVRNRAGADLIDLTPAQAADPAELRNRIAAGEWVVDLRSRKAFAQRHLAGTLSFGLDGSMATWLGWLAPWGEALTLLGDSPGQLADAQRELARIGIDRPVAATPGTPEQWAGGDTARLEATPVASFADLAAARSGRVPDHLPPPDVVLDVRLPGEWRDGHIDGAVHMPLPELARRVDEIPEGTVWVHCTSGYRAATAGSLLQRAGRRTVHIDDAYSGAATAGLAEAR